MEAQSNFDDLKGLESLIELAIFLIEEPTSEWYTKLGETPGGGGGYFRNFWVGMCRWPIPDLYQS